MPEDSDLVERLKQGENTAWKTVYEDNAVMIRRIGYSQMLSGEVIEDILQETMFCAYKGIDRFQNKSTIATWIFRIAVNHYRLHLRTITNRAKGHAKYSIEQQVKGTNTDGYTRRQLEAREGIIVASHVLAATKPRAYDSIMLSASGHTLIEIAELTGVPLSTANSRITYGRKELKRQKNLGLFQ